MAGTIVLLVSFAVALIGVIQSNKSDDPNRRFGLTRIGLSLVFVSVFGLVFAVYDQVQNAMQIDQIAKDSRAAALALEEKNPGAAAALRKVGEALDQRRSAIEGSDFSEALVSAADFSYARIDRSRFSGADLSGSDFLSARLDDSLFDHTRFFRSNFLEADLRGSTFEGANFSGVDLSVIHFDESTKFPPGH